MYFKENVTYLTDFWTAVTKSLRVHFESNRRWKGAVHFCLCARNQLKNGKETLHITCSAFIEILVCQRHIEPNPKGNETGCVITTSICLL